MTETPVGLTKSAGSGPLPVNSTYMGIPIPWEVAADGELNVLRWVLPPLLEEVRALRAKSEKNRDEEVARKGDGPLCVNIAPEAGCDTVAVRPGSLSTLDQLVQLLVVTWDGNLISKSDRDELCQRGLAARTIRGGNFITHAGLAELLAHGRLPDLSRLGGWVTKCHVSGLKQDIDKARAEINRLNDFVNSLQASRDNVRAEGDLSRAAAESIAQERDRARELLSDTRKQLDEARRDVAAANRSIEILEPRANEGIRLKELFKQVSAAREELERALAAAKSEVSK